MAFIPNPLGLETVNHIDGNKLNNTLYNLEWMSRPDNQIHSREILGLKPIPYSKSLATHHLLAKTGVNSNAGKKVLATFNDGTSIVYGSAYEAAGKLFDNCELGKSIRQSISRNSPLYKGINFKDYEQPNNTP